MLNKQAPILTAALPAPPVELSRETAFIPAFPNAQYRHNATRDPPNE
jgi:hypothetical protein